MRHPAAVRRLLVALAFCGLTLVLQAPAAAACQLISSGFSSFEPVDSSLLNNRMPLILIHGINLTDGSPAPPNCDTWAAFIDYYKTNNAAASLRDAYKLYQFSYNSNIVSLTELGNALRLAIDNASNDPSFGNQNIAIVAHSMGGLVARRFMRLQLQTGYFAGKNGGDRVFKLITLGTPHHGSPLANGPARDEAACIYAPVALYAFECAKWGEVLREVDSRIPPYNQVNRSSLHWDNYDGRLDYDTYVSEQNVDLELMNDNPPFYDDKIVAYAGAIEPPDVICFPGVNDTDCPLNWGSQFFRGVFDWDSDGVVPVRSAQFDGHTILGRPEVFWGLNHTELPNSSKVWEAIRNDLLKSPPATSSDLKPQSIVLSSTALSPASGFTAKWSLANTGSAAADGSSTTVVRISQSPTKAAGTNLAFVSTPALSAGNSVAQSVTLAAPTEPGRYYVWVIADNYGDVSNQSNTSNDLQPSAVFTVLGPSADLIPLSILPSSTTIPAGASFTANWALSNNGTAAANSTSTTVVRINQSSDSAAPKINLNAVSTPALLPGASAAQSVTLHAPTVPGTYYVWVIADNFGEVTNQSDVANDLQHSAAITVIPTSNTLQVAPTTGVTVSHIQGGAYSPPSFDYQVSASSGTVNYQISGIPSWLTPSSTGGGVGTSQVPITFSPNATAGALSPGTYNATLAFTNSGNGQVTQRAVTLMVAPSSSTPQLVVNPSSGSTSGQRGGTFAPIEFQVTASSGNINFSVDQKPFWLDADSYSGVAGSGPTTVTFNVNADGKNLSPGTYFGEVFFAMNGGGVGSVFRTVTLTVTEPPTGELAVSPGTGFTITGPIGGPFSPTSFDYFLSSTSGWVDWGVSIAPAYFDANFTHGSVAPSGSNITFTSCCATSLAVGTYDAAITFTDKTNAKTITRTGTIVVTKAITATALSASPNPCEFGHNVTFTATVESQLATPRGQVTFKDGATVLGIAWLENGKATLQTSALTVGAHTITATYEGGDWYATSTSAAVVQTITVATTPVLSITPPNQNVGADSGATSFNLSNTGVGALTYSASVSSSSNWAHITSGATGGDSGTINVTAEPNSGVQRQGTITVTATNAGGATNSPTSVTVTQAAGPVLSVTPSDQPVAAAGGNTSLSVGNTGGGTLNYSAGVTSGANWLHVTSGATGGNSGTINATADPSSGAKRQGTIRVTATNTVGTPVMASPRDVTVTQDATTENSYSLSVAIAGRGTVISSPAGINCPGDCTESYPIGGGASAQPVQLVATAAPGWTFAGWSGVCIGTGSCTISMTQSKDVVAIFNVPLVPGFQAIDFLPGGNYAAAVAISADGKVVVGEATDNNGRAQAFRWENGTTGGLGFLPGGADSHVGATNADGSVVVGWGYGSTDCSNDNRAFRWAGTIEGLGACKALADGLNFDGTVATGWSWVTGTQAIQWVDGTTTIIGVPPGYEASNAFAVNPTGTVAVGSASNSAGSTPGFRWNSENGFTLFDSLGVRNTTRPYAVNTDGSVVAGTAYNINNSPPYVSDYEAFRWVNGQMTGLGFLPGYNMSFAAGISADGSVVVGSSANDNEGRAYRWTATDGMQSIEDLLVANGVDINGWAFGGAESVSADGTVIAGRCTDPTGINRPCVFSIPLPLSLVSTPQTSLSITGSEGGPFAPGSIQFQLRASSGSVDFSVAKPDWLDVSLSAGTVTNSTTTITFTLNAGTNSLAPDTYTAPIRFTNVTNGRGSATYLVTLKVNALSPTCSLNVAPATIKQGESATLSWTSQNSTSVSIPGVGEFGPSGSVTVAPPQTKTYVATCTGPGGNATSGATISVLFPPSCTLGAAPSIISYGESVGISWTSTDAEVVTISPDIGLVGPSGLISVKPERTTTYTGSGSGSGGTSECSSTTVTVNKATATTALSASPNPSSFGQTVTLTATVSSAVVASAKTSGNAAASSAPGGTLTFKDGTTVLGTASLSGGTATLAVSDLSVGSHTLTAVYAGDSNYSGSTSSSVGQTVNPASTGTAISASPSPSSYGQTVTLTATVNSAVVPSPKSGGKAAALNAPSGTLTFKDGTTVLGTTSLSGGTATLAVSDLSVGSHTLTAVYAGDGSYRGSTSSSVVQTVSKGKTTVTASVAPKKVAPGAVVTLNAQVNVTSPLVATPTGDVTFKEKNVTLGTGTITSGVTQLTVNPVPIGTHRITAVYSGDNQLTASSGVTSFAVSAAIGPQTRVNTTIAGSQQMPAVAALMSGYVLVWASNGQDGSGYGIYVQRYTMAGAKVGGELAVNTANAGDQTLPAVAGLSDGGFVVIWQSNGEDGSGWGVYGQRFDATGAKAGVEFRINPTTAGDQSLPAVAAFAGGGFVAAWTSNGQDGSGLGVYARRYTATGHAQGGQFRVNVTTAGDQSMPAIAALTGGGFVIAWQSAGQDGSGLGIYGRRYGASGKAVAGEFKVNTVTVNDQSLPSIAPLDNGGFVIAWQSALQDGSGLGVYAQRYTAAGIRAGGETLINTTTADDQGTPRVAGFGDGGYVVVWASKNQDGSGEGVYAQGFKDTGAKANVEFRVNSATALDQYQPAAAASASGNFVAVWTSQSSDGSLENVFSQRYLLPGTN